MKKKASRSIEHAMEKLVFASRWLQAPIYLGIVMVLFAFIYFIGRDIADIFNNISHITDEQLIISALTLCEMGLLANLVIIVVISGYENFVSKLNVEHRTGEPIWIKRLHYRDVKMKIMSSIVALSSVQLLKLYLMKGSTKEEMTFAIATQLVFMLSIVALSITGVIESKYASNKNVSIKE